MLYSLALAASGLHLPGTTSKLLSFVPTAIVAVFALYDSWLWHLPGVVNLARRPYIAGTWRGTLISMQAAADAGESTSAPIEVVLTVRQTYTTVSLTLMTAESKSRSVAEQIVRNDNGDYTVYYQYRNVPKLGVRERSPEHTGSSALEISGVKPQDAESEYWTNRRTRGTFSVHRVSSKIAGSFGEGNVIEERI